MPYESADAEIIDPDRYDSAAGWQPKDPYEKQRKLVRKLYPDYGSSPFEVHPANKSAARAGNHTTGPLFGDMWRRGEVAVLFGESGVGKSILAMHIAETIARGKGFADGFAAPRAQPVVYFDFELTDIQFRERYSVQQEKTPANRSLFTSIASVLDTTEERISKEFADHINVAATAQARAVGITILHCVLVAEFIAFLEKLTLIRKTRRYRRVIRRFGCCVRVVVIIRPRTVVITDVLSLI